MQSLSHRETEIVMQRMSRYVMRKEAETGEKYGNEKVTKIND